MSEERAPYSVARTTESCSRCGRPIIVDTLISDAVMGRIDVPHVDDSGADPGPPRWSTIWGVNGTLTLNGEPLGQGAAPGDSDLEGRGVRAWLTRDQWERVPGTGEREKLDWLQDAVDTAISERVKAPYLEGLARVGHMVQQAQAAGGHTAESVYLRQAVTEVERLQLLALRTRVRAMDP